MTIGTQARDASGNASHATYVGEVSSGPPLVPGPGRSVVLRDRGARSFATNDPGGEMQGVVTPLAQSDWVGVGGVFTWHGVARVDDLSKGEVVLFAGGTTDETLVRIDQGSSGRVRFWIDVINSVQWSDLIPSVLQVGAPFRWALTYDDATKDAELWIDGVSQGVQTFGAGTLGAPPGVTQIGVWRGGNSASSQFDGSMAHVAVYDSVIADARIQAWHAATDQMALSAELLADAPVAYWPLSELQPLSIRARAMSFGLVGQDTVITRLDGSEVVVQSGDRRWQASIEATELEVGDARAWTALLGKLIRLDQRVRVQPPVSTGASQTGYEGDQPLVAGAGQLGTSLAVDNMAPDTFVLAAGDYFEVSGELKIATADVYSDASGAGEVLFEPALRAPPADNALVNIRAPAATMRLANPEGVFSVRAPLLHQLQTLQMVEAF